MIDDNTAFHFQLYLRELPEPVFKFPLQDRIQHTGDLGAFVLATLI